MHPMTVLLGLLCAVLSAAAQPGLTDGSVYAAPPAPAKVGVWSLNSLPFYGTANGKEIGLEVALRDSLCQRAKLNCTVVPLPNLADRLTALKNVSHACAYVVLVPSITYLQYTLVTDSLTHFAGACHQHLLRHGRNNL